MSSTHTDRELAGRIETMARMVKGKPFGHWPAFYTGENLMVALVLNDTAALQAMNYTVLEAMDRVDLDARTLRVIELLVTR